MSGLFTQGGERKYVTVDEGWRLLDVAAAADEQEAAFCAVLLLCGCRVSEALGLRRPHIEAEQRVLRFRTLKRRRGAIVWRSVPVPDFLVSMLAALPERPDGRIFPWSRTTAWRLVKRLMAEANIDGSHASPKGLRHRFGVVAAGEGVPVALIQRWMGHSKLENTLIYLQAVGAEERQMASRLWGQARVATAAPFAAPEGVGVGGDGSVRLS